MRSAKSSACTTRSEHELNVLRRQQRCGRKDEGDEHEEKRGVSKRGAECDGRVRREADCDRRESQIREVDRSPQTERGHDAKRQQDDQNDRDRQRDGAGRSAVMTVEESPAPTGQRLAECGVARGEPRAQMNSRIGPPEQSGDRRRGEEGSASRPAREELPRHDCEQDHDERLLGQRQERETDPGERAPIANVRRKGSQ